MNILKSLDGRRAGFGPNGELIVTSGKILLGANGGQRWLGSKQVVSHFDDFLGNALNVQYTVVEGTDSATSAPSILAGGIGGVLRLTTGDAGTGLAADLIQVNGGNLQWQASNGGLYFETRLKLSQITESYVFVGFTDVLTLEAPIISAASADTFTTNASDAVGFMFDTGMATDNWWLTGVAANTDATMQDSTYAPVAATYETLRVEVSATGKATFFRNGVQVGTQMSGAVTAATDLCWTIGAGKLSTATSMTVDFDYIDVGMYR
ncbi:MAG: hypothetical protein AB7F22_17690 [Reyranella sp.]|uniref:hypothetical protein n=1 Tax=Reyranella sp. TaxID=1929291 RepID=UPI003D0E5A20